MKELAPLHAPGYNDFLNYYSIFYIIAIHVRSLTGSILFKIRVYKCFVIQHVLQFGFLCDELMAGI